MKVLITLGPTQEPIDEVRYITTGSSGKMGAALAAEGLKRGHHITVVSGPVNVILPQKAKEIKVRTADEMITEALKELGKVYDIFISTAAIADYTPERPAKGKISSGLKNFSVELKNNPKLTREAKKRFPGLYVVAFKAEYGLPEKKLIEKASAKLEREGLDLICANDIGKNKFGSDVTEFVVLDQKGIKKRLGKGKKEKLAVSLWDLMEKEKGR
jgi:phosphopantothenoylcysteine decarboxylase/phosphopantothenate--cysteine ligase